MTLTVVLRRAAQTEFDEAADWYEQQQTNLGLKFVAKVQATFDRICRVPRQIPIVFEEARQAIVDRFPDSVLFLVEQNELWSWQSSIIDAILLSGNVASNSATR